MEYHLVRFLLAAAALCGTASAQGIITTFAGNDWVFTGDGKPALDAPLGHTTGITVDAEGHPVVVDNDNCIVARIKRDGTLSVIAGNGLCFSTGDGGQATSAGLSLPYSAAYDAQGNLYVGTSSDIRKIDTAGVITTLAGGTKGTPISSVHGIAVDGAGNVYFGDFFMHVVRKLTPDGVLSTVAGNGSNGSGGDNGPATSASFGSIYGIALDQAGNLYIADPSTNRIRKVAGGIISTFVSNIGGPQGLAFDANGVLYFVAGFAVYKLPPGASTPMLIAGDTNQFGYSGDNGPALKALLGPKYVAPDNLGNVYVADVVRVRKISASADITRVAGNGLYRYGGEGIQAASASLYLPTDLTQDPAGNVYVSEFLGNRVRKVSNGILSTVAGNGQAGGSGDRGPATQANLQGPQGLAFNAGNLFIAAGNIRKVDPAGIISTYSAPPTSAGGLALDNNTGISYASSYQQNPSQIFKIDTNGKATLFAGGPNGFLDGPVATAQFWFPQGLALDSAGNLFVADYANRRVRKITPQGTVSTFAGNGNSGTTGDGGPALQATLGTPWGLAFDSSGNLYIADQAFGVIRQVTPSGSRISTVAGGGNPDDHIGDGKLATQAQLGKPTGLMFDPAGNLYIADQGTHRVREVLAAPPTMQVSPATLSFTAASLGVPVTKTLTVKSDISGLDFQIAIDTSIPGSPSTGAWLTADVPAASTASTPRLISITADPTSLTPHTYMATIFITPTANLPSPPPVNVTFDVGPALPPQLSVDKLYLSYTSPSGAGASSQTVKISNTGGGMLKFAASAGANAGGNWLKLPVASGQALPGKPAALVVIADPTGLGPGTYTGTVTIQPDTGSSVSIAVIMAISSQSQALLLTQSGLSFTAVEAGGAVPPQSFGVVNPGVGVLKWNATVDLSTGSWLTVTPDSGSSDSSLAAPQITVSVNPAGLDPGPHYGVVRVDAPGAANTPQVVTVFLNVLGAGSDPGARVQPLELVFFADPGAGPPSSQPLYVYNIAGTPKTFRSGRTSDGFDILTLPSEGALDPKQPTRVVVQPRGNPPRGNFPPKTYSGALTFQFSDGRVQSVKITVISPGPVSSQPGARNATSSGSCAPLIPTLTTLVPSFKSPAGWPVGLSVDVHDSCGNPHVSGTVTITASGTETPVRLEPLRNKDGTWQGTWETQGVSQSAVTLTIEADNPDLGLNGKQVIEGSLDPNLGAPQFTLLTLGSTANNMVGNTANVAPFQPLAPGSLLTIKGTNLADQSVPAPTGAYPTSLGTTKVRIANKQIPLQSVSSKSINAVLPFGLNPNTRHQVVVERGNTISDAVWINVAPAQPNIFVNPDTGYPMVTALRDDPSQPASVSPSAPVTAGDAITIECAGLGVTDQPVGDGQPGPGANPGESPAIVQAPVTVTIGNLDAPVAAARLKPGSIGVYQVDAVIPLGINPANTALTVTVANQTSPAVNLAIY